jgi:hypothetical protein
MNMGYMWIYLRSKSFVTGVITEIPSTNGYKNLASSNSYEVTHGPKLPQKHFQKVQNYTTSDKIKVRYDYTGRAHTCAIQKRRRSAHAHDARLWSLKATHILEWCIYEIGRPPTHFWFSFQVDLTPKSRLNLTGWLVKDLKMP